MNDPTGAKRVKRFREKAAKDGGRRLDLVLDRDAVDALVVCISAYGGKVSAAEIVRQLLQREAERLKAG